ncbi:MAG TPA: methyl-accepting chemotaxis protein [Azospirillum sp.]|nr:methyl-accepting chemotaxis protein [Azospirillum sp.]
MTIRTRLLASLLLLGILLSVSSACGLFFLNMAEDGLGSVYKDRVVPLRDLKVASDLYAVDIVDTSHKVRSGALRWEDGAASIRKALAETERRWSAYTATYMAPEERRLASEAASRMRQATAAAEALAALMQAKDKAGLDAFIDKQMYTGIDPFTEVIGRLVDLQISEAQAVYEETEANYHNSVLIMAAIVTLGFAAVAFALYTTIGRVTRPLNATAVLMERLATGDLGIEVTGADRRDEVGSLARSLLVFKDNGLEMRRLQAEQEQQKRQAEDERRRILHALAAQFESEVKGVVQSVMAAASQLQSSARSMSTIAEETTRQATTVAAATEQASANVQTVAAASDQLRGSIGEIGHQVGRSAAISREAVEAVERTNATVEGLSIAAQKIGDVVSLIQSIASQTNLLALNATIEAARAGEAGKGFAVVASEVKQLANQTAKATEDISTQIGEIQTATTGAVEAIRDIGRTIAQVSDIAGAIASAVEEQAAATQEIGRNVQQAAQGTQEVSDNITGVSRAAEEAGAAATQVLDAAGGLSRESGRLHQQVDAFIARVRAG